VNLNIVKLQTLWHLGFVNIATVIIYRLVKKTGLFEVLLPIYKFPTGHFFLEKSDQIKEEKHILRYFSYRDIIVNSPPDWLLNPYNDKRVRDNAQHWSKHSDFDPDLGDIKMVWEASRFDWLPKFAWQHQEGDLEALPRIEKWLQSWIIENPVNQGVNWKCGQEASFRCLNLMVLLLIMGSVYESPTPVIKFFLFHHLKRISLTLRYAMAQDNNHGTSEASALFVVGHYLSQYGNEEQQCKGEKWAKQGRYWLENRVKHLVMKDGSFSQNSVVYHRLLLDTLSVTELFRKKYKVSAFSALFYERAELSSLWLYTLTDSISGDAPNMGANDGAYLFNLSNAHYRDFRPSVQLACVLFANKSAYNEIYHPLMIVFAGGDKLPSKTISPPISKLFEEGGYASLTREVNSFAIMRLPIYRFRPSDADALHFDIWHNGINVLRDAGTYSYNAEEFEMNYFPGTRSHNTITFDDHDQMPRLGRFLFGGWLQSKKHVFNQSIGKVTARYCDKWGACHKRSISSTMDGWQVDDEISGFKQSAILHWNLIDDDWSLEDGWYVGSLFKIRVMGLGTTTLMMTLKSRWESQYYAEKHNMPVLEVECKNEKNIRTDIEFI